MKGLLVIEDAPNVMNWLLDCLARSFPDVPATGASNGRQARQALLGDHPATVILDLNLPPSEDDPTPSVRVGLELLDIMAQMRPRPRVVVFSSLALGQEALNRGADAFVQKDVADPRKALIDALTTPEVL